MVIALSNKLGEFKIKFPCEKIESHKDGFRLMYTVQRLDAIDGSSWGWYVDDDVRWLSVIMKKREGNENEGKIS